MSLPCLFRLARSFLGGLGGLASLVGEGGSLLCRLFQALFEFLNAAAGIHYLFLAGVERVAGGANGYIKFRLGGAGRPVVATGAFDLGVGVILGMNVGLHM